MFSFACTATGKLSCISYHFLISLFPKKHNRQQPGLSLYIFLAMSPWLLLWPPQRKYSFGLGDHTHFLSFGENMYQEWHQGQCYSSFSALLFWKNPSSLIVPGFSFHKKSNLIGNFTISCCLLLSDHKSVFASLPAVCSFFCRVQGYPAHKAAGILQTIQIPSQGQEIWKGTTHHLDSWRN